MQSLLPEEDVCCRVRQLYRNTLTTDFTHAFQNYHNKPIWISPLVGQVIPSQSGKSHYFFYAHGGIYSVNVFLS